MKYAVKDGLGDWSSRLRDRLKVGLPVSVEGPYRCFDFSDRRSRQIWVGAGIGITPFIARLKSLARFLSEQKIDLFYATIDKASTAPTVGEMPQHQEHIGSPI